MNINCIVSDSIARIKNAVNNDQLSVQVLCSKHCLEVLKLLERAKILRSVTRVDAPAPKDLRINIEMYSDGFQRLEMVSTPGRAVHVKKGEIPRYKNGFGVVVVSTSKGIMTGEDARKHGIGGKVLVRAF
jgi:small subunit ribosomal protein S8